MSFLTILKYANNSLDYIDVNGTGNGNVTVQIDTGSPAFAFGVGNVVPDNEVLPLSPLPQGSEMSLYNIDMTSINQQSYGSGGFSSRMANGEVKVAHDEYTNITFGAIFEYAPPFPMGGPYNDIGILGLCWNAQEFDSPSPYCINNDAIIYTDLGPTCNNTDDIVENIPLLYQLKANGVVQKLAIELIFEGNTSSMNRYGQFSMGGDISYDSNSPNVLDQKTVPLNKLYSSIYAHYYLISVPSMKVGNMVLPFGEYELEGNNFIVEGNNTLYYGGWTVDTGTTYSLFPEAIYLNATAAIWEQYTGSMSYSSWLDLVSINSGGGAAGGDGCTTNANWCAPMDEIPCVNLSEEELQGLPDITMDLQNGTWVFPAENYMWPIREDTTTSPGTKCYQLGFGQSDYGLIGNLQMQGHQLYFDLENKVLTIGVLNSSSPSPSPSIPPPTPSQQHAISSADIIGIAFAVVIGVCILYGIVQRCLFSRKTRLPSKVDNKKELEQSLLQV